MARIKRLGALLSASLVAVAATECRAQSSTSPAPASGSAGAGQDGGSGADPTKIPAAVSPGWRWAWYRPYVIVQGTPDGGTVSTLHVPYGAMVPQVGPSPMSLPTAPAPPPGLIRPASVERRKVVKKADRERAESLTTIGDRMFRIGNHGRAEERYEQAARLNPFSATPRMRLAQIALVREKYALAADLLREAETAQPGWLATAKDVQSLYAEPADFARRIARLEEHLHKDPEDRDAWLVLGAQWFLSRRESRAADVFLRLDDPRRKPDVALAAFLDAARLRQPAPKAPAPSEPGRDPFQPPADEEAPRP